MKSVLLVINWHTGGSIWGITSDGITSSCFDIQDTQSATLL